MSATPSSAPSKHRFSALANLLPFLQAYWLRICLAGLALLVAAGATLLLPIAFRHLIDQGFKQGAGEQINQYFLALFALSVVLALATAARFYWVSWLGERVTADIREAVYSHVIRMSPEYFELTQSGEVLSRLTTDTTLIQTVVGTSLSMGLRNVLLMLGGLIMLWITSPSLTAYILVTLLVVVLPIIIFGRKVRALSKSTQDKIADSSAMAGEVLNAIPTVQAFNREAYETQRFATAVRHSFEAALARIRARAALTVIVILLIFGAIVFVLWLGAHAVLQGEMSAGELGQFILYAVVTAGAIGALAEVWGDLQRAAGASERLMALLALNSPIQSPAMTKTIGQGRGDIVLEGLSFHYPSRPEQWALSQLDLQIQPGEHVALVGSSGAGKTTLFQLLLRFYDPQQGSIFLAGNNLRDLSLNDVRQQIGVVLQDSVIFAGSVLDNIRYGQLDATQSEVQAAAQAAAAHEFISRLPQGYDTYLGERGVRLSGGQRQRLAIARAILKNPAILLLDEATSALDAESEQLVQQALEQASQNRTTLVIAHRLATVKQADRIIVLEQGRIIAQGNHQALLLSSPRYAKLAALQFTSA